MNRLLPILLFLVATLIHAAAAPAKSSYDRPLALTAEAKAQVAAAKAETAAVEGKYQAEAAGRLKAEKERDVEKTAKLRAWAKIAQLKFIVAGAVAAAVVLLVLNFTIYLMPPWSFIAPLAVGGATFGIVWVIL